MICSAYNLLRWHGSDARPGRGSLARPVPGRKLATSPFHSPLRPSAQPNLVSDRPYPAPRLSSSV
ncbi:protein of unknown function [Methylorubrum extorquens]|uniref:Uncharacterized protein n=1 Tax=Methylorubrum extorquens TaxID=408 RepID=A0A2N9AXI9_METEX|nr:protein of unknown function [Methylorubrum extorquens]